MKAAHNQALVKCDAIALGPTDTCIHAKGVSGAAKLLAAGTN